ncbi:hypothetical protein F5B19DRAFT_286378 [Rostrohypoxylon terebratum]|nr:hypothetical protein F5B19DRAFT_286378 [Rostrohypoxylon terebratum]
MALQTTQGVTPHIVIDATPIKATTTGVFPAELWLEVGKLLEEEDDRESLFALMRCNRKFKGMIQPVLYKRFFTDNKKLTKPRSLAGFMQAVTTSPWLGQFTKVVKVKTVIPPNDRFTNGGTTSPAFYGNEATLPTDDYFKVTFIISALLVELLPTLLPKLEKYECPWGNSWTGNVVPRTWSFLRNWAGSHETHRLNFLKEITVTKNVTDHCFEAFHIVEQLTLAAPSVETMDIRISNVGHRPFGMKLVKPITGTNEIAAWIGRLRDVRFQTDDCTEFSEGFHFVARCRSAERIELCLQVRIFSQIGQRELDQLDVNDMLWHLAPDCLQDASPARFVPDPAIQDLPRWGGLYTLRDHKDVKHVTINQNALMFAAIMRVRGNIHTDKLVGFLPESIEALRLVGVSIDLLPSLDNLAEHMQRGRYPNLKTIEIERVLSTPANHFMVRKEHLVLKDYVSLYQLCDRIYHGH